MTAAGLPERYVEMYTRDCPPGRVRFYGFVNRPTPSGSDRPWLAAEGNRPLLLDRLVPALEPGMAYYVDGVRHDRDDTPSVPYKEDHD